MTFQSTVLVSCFAFCSATFAGDPVVLNIWPSDAPGETKQLPAEADTSNADSRQVAGKSVVRLGNVSTPQIHVYRPPAEKANGTSVVICPGGGHHILAWDLEGIEVAEWLNTLGVTGIVLKYRVPAREKDNRYRAAVQDAQRAVSLVRSKAKEWQLDTDRIGICGFSAGGETAGLTSLFADRTYENVDAVDDLSMLPNFAMLIYPAYLVPRDGTELRKDVVVTKRSPPMFFVHAWDDPVTPLTTLELAAALKRSGVSAEVHLYAKGGHGYGLRPTEMPITGWPDHAAAWLKQQGLLTGR